MERAEDWEWVWNAMVSAIVVEIEEQGRFEYLMTENRLRLGALLFICFFLMPAASESTKSELLTA